MSILSSWAAVIHTTICGFTPSCMDPKHHLREREGEGEGEGEGERERERCKMEAKAHNSRVRNVVSGAFGVSHISSFGA